MYQLIQPETVVRVAVHPEVPNLRVEVLQEVEAMEVELEVQERQDKVLMVHGVFMLGIREVEEEPVKLVLPIQQKEEMAFFLLSQVLPITGQAAAAVRVILE
jgi:hypothetical protein